jgi:hypothetical protein
VCRFTSLTAAAHCSDHCRLAVAGVVASSAVYVTARLAEVVGHASYVTALAIAKSLPGHKKRKKGKCEQTSPCICCILPAATMAILNISSPALQFLQA